MSSDYAVKIDNLAKCYQIYDKPQDRLKQSLYPRVQRLFRRDIKQYFHEFWALRDCSIEIKRGETVGIIGRNGAGKSTLLQLICGTLTPTCGTVQVNGRIAALLELGSGFNPEFTGRENVFLNASILGLTQEEIEERFERIERFADIGDFIDQPVKTYSSGMQVRLAFAVVAHVDADILVVDEALAVGDAIFTQKCMRFIRKFKDNGTLLFVSHDTSSVINLCDKAIWLHEGQIRQVGKAKGIAEAYLQYTLQKVYGDEATLSALETKQIEDAVSHEEESQNDLVVDYGSLFKVADNLNDSTGWKTGAGEILSVELMPVHATCFSPSHIFKGGEHVRLRIRAITHQSMVSPILGFLGRDRLGQELFGENTLQAESSPLVIEKGTTLQGEFVFYLPMLPNGQFSITATFAEGDQQNHIQHHWLNEALIITVYDSKVRWGLVGVTIEKVDLKEIYEVTERAF